MDPISGINQIIGALRKQALVRKNTSKNQKTPGQEHSTIRASDTDRLNLQQLEQRIVERINSVNEDGEEPTNKASEIFIESVLVWEFGDQIATDPEFRELITKIKISLQSHPETKKKLDELLKLLKN